MVAFKSTGEAARALGISEAALQATLRRRPELAPQTKVGGRRAWSDRDLERVREARGNGGSARKGA